MKRPRDEEGGEHVDHQADEQGHAEALDLLGAHEDQHDGGEAGGGVGVKNRPEDLVVALLDGHPQAGPAVDFLADAFVDQDVGVNRHAQREHQARDAGQGERPADHGHGRQDQHQIEHQRHVREGARDGVIDAHEHHDRQHREERRVDARRDVVGPHVRRDVLHRDRFGFQRRRQRAGVHDLLELLGLLLDGLRRVRGAGLAESDDARLVDLRLDVRGAHGLVIQQDGHGMVLVEPRQVAHVAADRVQPEGQHQAAAARIAVGVVGGDAPGFSLGIRVRQRVVVVVVAQDVGLAGPVGGDVAAARQIVLPVGIDFEPARHRAVGPHLLLGPALGEALDGLGQVGADFGGLHRDAEIQHAGLGDQALQLLGRIHAPAAQHQFVLVGRDQGQNFVLLQGVFVGQRLQVLLRLLVLIGVRGLHQVGQIVQVHALAQGGLERLVVGHLRRWCGPRCPRRTIPTA